MMYKITAYISFIFSVFFQKKPISNDVLDLTQNCFRKQVEPKKITQFNRYKQQLLHNKKTIEVTDFGAGSRVFNSNHRKVSDIVKHAGIHTKHAKLLINLVTYFQPKNILEIGTSVGLGTAALAIGNPNATIISLEGCAKTAHIAQENLKLNNLLAAIYVGNFENTLHKAIQNKQFDLIYFDGNHEKQATLNYFEQCLLTANEKSIFIFDDIYWSKSMQEAWIEIKNNPKVSTTINTFQWGIVFFNPKEKKEHYLIQV